MFRLHDGGEDEHEGGQGRVHLPGGEEVRSSLVSEINVLISGGNVVFDIRWRQPVYINAPKGHVCLLYT